MPSGGRSISLKISEIFQAAQQNSTCHQGYIKKLRKIYDKSDFEEFTKEFIDNLRLPMTYMEKVHSVEYSLQFASKFTISLQPHCDNEDEDEEMAPFIVKIFEFLLNHHNATNVAVRYRICYFLNMLLDTMGDNASIEDDLCNRILQSMMDRIQDKSPKVRAQAAIALHRLQEPTNPNCLVISVYLFHLAKDPSSEVRRVILAKMAKNKQTLSAAIKRTRDIDDSVRKMAYLFISKITVKSLTMSQREQLLNHGLKDRSEMIKKTVRDILVPAWLRYYDNNYLNFIKAIDSEHASDTVMLALNCLFKNAETKVLIEQLPLDNNKFVSIDQLTCDTVLYWRCLAEFLKNENLSDEFDLIMPELTPLCGYIKDYIKILSEKSTQQYEEISQQFILLQLFEMVKFYDLADESGRKNLKELIIETLSTECCSEKVTDCLVKYFESVVPDTNDRISLLVEVISEKRMPAKTNIPSTLPMSDDERHERKMMKARLGIHLLELEDEEYAAIQQKDYAKAQKIQDKVNEIKTEIEKLSTETQVIETNDKNWEEKNDPKTIIQCLQIMYSMMQSRTITSLTPTLRSLMESLVIPHLNLETDDEKKLYLALNCLGLCCLVDKELAKRNLNLFLVYTTETENEELWTTITKILFDLLLKHGLECFDIDQKNDENNTSHNKRSRSVRSLYCHTDDDTNVNDKQVEAAGENLNVVKILMTLLDSHIQSLQTIATEGLCKLILLNRISIPSLVSQLIILWHNPTTKENAYLSQCLCVFFQLFVNKVQNSHTILEETYLPTLKILANAPEMSPLHEIDLLKVSHVIISLTTWQINNTYSIHNNLTFIIINEALNPDTDIPLDVLVKSLKFLDVQFDSEDCKKNILEALNNLENLLNDSGEKRLLNWILQFKNKITSVNTNTENGNENNVSQVENPVDNDEENDIQDPDADEVNEDTEPDR